MKIKKGDTVEVIRGEHRGERGKVNRIVRKRDASGRLDPNQVYVVVAGVNLIINNDATLVITTGAQVTVDTLSSLTFQGSNAFASPSTP